MRRMLFSPWMLVPLLVLASVVALAVQRARVPSRADWQAAAAHIEAQRQPGDGVTLVPDWAGEARLALHGLPAFPTPEPAQADLGAYDRVWVLGGWGQGAADLAGGHTVLSSARFGAATVELVQVGGDRVLGDLRTDLERARVQRRRDGGRVETCDFWDGRGWHCTLRKSPEATRACLASPTAQRLNRRRQDPHCGLDPWLNVSRDWRVIDDAPRACVWLHPIANGEVEVAWDAPDGPTLEVRYGFTDKVIFAHDRAESRTQPATLTLWRGDTRLGSQTVEPTRGWHRWDVPWGTGSGPLRLTARTTRQTDAHLCVAARVRGPR